MPNDIFKFQIGDYVSFKAMIEIANIQGEHRYRHRPQLLVIRERHLQECPGGNQVSYLVRVIGVGRGGVLGSGELSFVRDLFPVNEVEVESIKASDYFKSKDEKDNA